MREIVHQQPPHVAPFIDHDHAQELAAMDVWLVAIPSAFRLVYEDLIYGLRDPGKGRKNRMTAEQVLRALVLMKMREFTYEDLAFHLADSTTYRAFCHIGIGDKGPSVSALQRDFKTIRPETLEAVNRMLVEAAVDAGIEKGREVRIDCTVTETHIHEPSDAEQLWDCDRVLTRCLHRAREFTEVGFTDHTRRAKRRRMSVLNA